jgi:hypothetical protein
MSCADQALVREPLSGGAAPVFMAGRQPSSAWMAWRASFLKDHKQTPLLQCPRNHGGCGQITRCFQAPNYKYAYCLRCWDSWWVEQGYQDTIPQEGIPMPRQSLPQSSGKPRRPPTLPPAAEPLCAAALCRKPIPEDSPCPGLLCPQCCGNPTCTVHWADGAKIKHDEEGSANATGDGQPGSSSTGGGGPGGSSSSAGAGLKQ